MALRPEVRLSRSTIIVGAVLGGYVLYVLAKGTAGNYVSLMIPSQAPSAAAAAGVLSPGGDVVPGGNYSNPVGTTLGGNQYYADPAGGFGYLSGQGSSGYSGPGGYYQNTNFPGGQVI